MDIAHGRKDHLPHQRVGVSSVHEQSRRFHDQRYRPRIEALAGDEDVDEQTRHSVIQAELRHNNDSSISHSPTVPLMSSISNRRGIDLNIPRFNQVAGAHQPIFLPPSSNTDSRTINLSNLLTHSHSKEDLISIHDTRQQLLRSHSLGPLTPPHDIEARPWSRNLVVSSPTEAEHESADCAPQKEVFRGTGAGLSLLRSHGSQLPSKLSGPSQGLSHLPWLDQALRAINRESENQPSPQYVEFVSQVLPNHASDRRLVKTSELVCDHLQQAVRALQGITITHAIAVPQSQVVEDFPKSPPTTPNFMVANGYFDEPIVVTKAANVPIYHGVSGRIQEAGVHIQRRIMVRSVVDIALLERCIPPTTAGEIADFFNADSYRSYLADRLSELAIGSGSLLLIYPTRLGGQTFARKYIAPILDPLLREMSILRGLDTDAAQRLGSMDSVDSMLSFAEMKSKVESLCTNMSDRSRALSVRSSYKLVHCQVAEVVLDRATWMTWYVEQEQPRLKQNLVDYHKDGGRLPQGDGGTSELTAGMLTREIIEGLQKSKNEAGNVGIEVGIFMVQRTKRSST